MYSARLKSEGELGPLWPFLAALTLMQRREACKHHLTSCWELGASMHRACRPRLHSTPLNARGLPARWGRTAIAMMRVRYRKHPNNRLYVMIPPRISPTQLGTRFGTFHPGQSRGQPEQFGQACTARLAQRHCSMWRSNWGGRKVK